MVVLGDSSHESLVKNHSCTSAHFCVWDSPLQGDFLTRDIDQLQDDQGGAP